MYNSLGLWAFAIKGSALAFINGCVILGDRKVVQSVFKNA